MGRSIPGLDPITRECSPAPHCQETLFNPVLVPGMESSAELKVTFTHFPSASHFFVHYFFLALYSNLPLRCRKDQINRGGSWQEIAILQSPADCGEEESPCASPNPIPNPNPNPWLWQLKAVQSPTATFWGDVISSLFSFFLTPPPPIKPPPRLQPPSPPLPAPSALRSLCPCFAAAPSPRGRGGAAGPGEQRAAVRPQPGHPPPLGSARFGRKAERSPELPRFGPTALHALNSFPTAAPCPSVVYFIDRSFSVHGPSG